MFSQTTIVKVFADQSEVSALPVGCMNQSGVSALPAGYINQSEVSALPAGCMNQSEVSALSAGYMNQSEVSALPAGCHSLSTRSKFNQLTFTRKKRTRPHITQKNSMGFLGLVTQVFAFMQENNSFLS